MGKKQNPNDPYNDPTYRKIMDEQVYPKSGHGVTPGFQASVDQANAAFRDAEQRGSGGSAAAGGELITTICLTGLVGAIIGAAAGAVRRRF